MRRNARWSASRVTAVAFSLALALSFVPTADVYGQGSGWGGWLGQQPVGRQLSHPV